MNPVITIFFFFWVMKFYQLSWFEVIKLTLFIDKFEFWEIIKIKKWFGKEKKKMKGIQNFKVSLQLRWIKWVQLNDDQTYPQKKKEKRKRKRSLEHLKEYPLGN